VNGIGRFDMNSGAEVEALAGELRGIVLNPARSQWVAIQGENDPANGRESALVVGEAASLEYQVLPSTEQPDMVFFGSDGRLYYTSRQLTGGESVPILGDYFTFYETSLWVFDESWQADPLLWQSADYAYAGVKALPDGSVFFVLVENGTALYEAAQRQDVTADEVAQYQPQAHIMYLAGAGATPVVWLENAGQLAVTTP
jgi:hypothetical protein